MAPRPPPLRLFPGAFTAHGQLRHPRLLGSLLSQTPRPTLLPTPRGLLNRLFLASPMLMRRFQRPALNRGTRTQRVWVAQDPIPVVPALLQRPFNRTLLILNEVWNRQDDLISIQHPPPSSEK